MQQETAGWVSFRMWRNNREAQNQEFDMATRVRVDEQTDATEAPECLGPRHTEEAATIPD